MKEYDLEKRTLEFAKRVRVFVKNIPMSISNNEDCKQLVRSSGSVGANYIEANEALSKRDFAMRIKISRKEAKESIYWLRLIDVGDSESLERERSEMADEAMQLLKIFTAIITKSTKQLSN